MYIRTRIDIVCTNLACFTYLSPFNKNVFIHRDNNNMNFAQYYTFYISRIAT